MPTLLQLGLIVFFVALTVAAMWLWDAIDPSLNNPQRVFRELFGFNAKPGAFIKVRGRQYEIMSPPIIKNNELLLKARSLQDSSIRQHVVGRKHDRIWFKYDNVSLQSTKYRKRTR